MEKIEVYIGIGSNVGDRMANIENGIKLLSREIQINQISSIYETVPVGFANQAYFLNCVCGGSTYLEPEELLLFLKDIEILVGRTKTFPGGPRVFDADLLFYGTFVFESPCLTIPHPGIKTRAFVLIPLCEISHALVHPVYCKTVFELLEEVQDTNGVVLYSSPLKIDIIAKRNRAVVD